VKIDQDMKEVAIAAAVGGVLMIAGLLLLRYVGLV
jgi:hypothetical protein